MLAWAPMIADSGGGGGGDTHFFRRAASSESRASRRKADERGDSDIFFSERRQRRKSRKSQIKKKNEGGGGDVTFFWLKLLAQFFRHRVGVSNLHDKHKKEEKMVYVTYHVKRIIISMNNHLTPKTWGDIWYCVPHLQKRGGTCPPVPPPRICAHVC